MFEISPSTTSKRPSFRLMENHPINIGDAASNESPKHPLSRYHGIEERVKEEEEDDYVEEVK